MIRSIGTKSKPRPSIKTAALLAISAALVLATSSGPAGAEERHDDRGHGGRHDDRGRDGGYYRAPPVVYGSPYSYGPPPVVYGPAIGINLPGINIGIR